MSFFLEAGMATGYLLLKLFLIFSIAKLIRLKWAFDQISSLVTGWLMIQALQSGIILGLSSVDLLYRPYFLAFVSLSASLIYWQTRTLQFDSGSIQKSWHNYSSLIAIIFVLLGMWLRSNFFYDYTWDAQTYGIPRLAIWLNYGSVFVHMPTPQLNLFVNEWNGELNALAYALASGGYLGFSFGNLEILLLLFIVIAWVAFLLGSPLFWALWLSAVLGSTPAILGLASTIKGDILACTAFMVTIAWLIYIKCGNQSPMAFWMLLLSATLAVGSKISVVLPVLAIFALSISLIGISRFRDLWRLSGLIKLSLVLSLLIFSSRFWANWIIYGNPLKRIDAEQTRFSISHLFGNLEVVWDRVFGVWGEIQGDGSMWALAGSMGVTTWFIFAIAIAVIIVNVFRWFDRASTQYLWLSTKISLGKDVSTTIDNLASNQSKIGIKWLVLVGIIILITTVISMALSGVFPWTFRYFAPGVMMLVLGVGSITFRTNITEKFNIFAIISAALVVVVNLAITLRPGEVLPISHFRPLVTEIKQANTPLKRISLLIKGPYQLAGVESIGLDVGKPLDILVYQNVDTSLIPFIGSHAQNNIRTVADTKDLIVTSTQQAWDVVAIVQKIDLRDRSIYSALERQGYFIAVDNSYYVIALPKQRIEQSLLLDLNGIQWIPWNSAAGAQLSFLDGLPEVESPFPIDAGFVSQELRFDGPTLIKASFEGEIAGLGNHAAHLSLHGKRLIITLPTGRYSSSQSFQGVVPALYNDDSLQQLSFGLGGWAEGSGRLRLVSLELFKLSLGGEYTSLGTFNLLKTQQYSAWMVFILSVTLLAGCAIFGRFFLSILMWNKNLSIMGINFIFGYGIFGLVLIFSLKYFGNPMFGALGFFGLLIMMMLYRFYYFRMVKNVTLITPQWRGIFKNRYKLNTDNFKPSIIESLITVVIVSWVIAIALTYLPLTWLAIDPKYQFPDIFDLPKHFFAEFSLFRANTWPPPSPFFRGETFAYNFLFYAIPAFIAKLVSDPLANFQTFPLVVIAIAIALPMTILDIVRNITQSKFVHLSSVLLATWVGGLTPLWVERQPSIGYFLYTEKLITSPIWVDELFESLIFVPQHIFAVLCGLVIVFLLANIQSSLSNYKFILVAGIIMLAGTLSSFILLPHLVVTYVFGVMITFLFYWKTVNQGQNTLKKARLLLLIMTFFLPLTFIFPFLIEVLKWSGETGPMITIPELSIQWFYVLSALGIATPLAVIGLVPLFRKTGIYGIESHGKCLLVGMTILVVIGLTGFLFGGYPDAGLKSGLWIRISFIPLASIGLLVLIRKAKNFPINVFIITCVAVLFISIAIVNYPTTRYFVKSAWLPIDPGVKIFLSYIRSLPETSRIALFSSWNALFSSWNALFSSDQVFVATSGRQIDFDMSIIRPDAYMPPEGRLRARHFWDRFMQNDSEIWLEINQHYDYLIAPVGSPADIRLSEKFTGSVIGGYSVYKTRIDDDLK